VVKVNDRTFERAGWKNHVLLCKELLSVKGKKHMIMHMDAMSGDASVAEENDDTRVTYNLPVSNRYDQNGGCAGFDQVRRKRKETSSGSTDTLQRKTANWPIGRKFA